MAFVAAAGPISNIILAALTGLFFRLGMVTPHSIFTVFLYILFIINIGLAVFNLLPIYPLDGSRILMAFLKGNQITNYLRAMTVVPKIFLGMIVAEWFFKIPILSSLLNPIFIPVFKITKTLFIGN